MSIHISPSAPPGSLRIISFLSLWGVGLIAFDPVASAQQSLTVEECLEALDDFESQFWGLEVDVELSKPWDSVELGPADPRSFTRTCRVAQGVECTFSRTLTKSAFHYGPERPAGAPEILRREEETCHIDGQSITHVRALHDGREVHRGVVGSLDQVTTRPISLSGPYCYPFGLSSWDESFLSELIRRPDAAKAVTAGKFEAKDVTFLSVALPERGQYEFVFSSSPPHRLRQFSIRKTSGDVYTGGGEDLRVGVAGRDEGVSYDRIVAVFRVEEYQHLMDRQVIKRALVQESLGGDGKVHHSKNVVDVSNLAAFDVTDNTRAVFDELPISDGTPVAVGGHEGLAYVFRDGRIERFVDSEAIGTIDGVRYRKPKSGLPSWILPALLVVIVGILVWRIYRRNSA